jgi:signal transduction histidine kinase/ActR/RegA family two-component response regulator
VVKLFTDLIKAGENQLPKAYPFRGLHKNGNWVWLEGQPRIEFDAAGRPVSYQDVVRDISARKLLEQELKAAKNAAEAAGRAKADFLANMSHELRTPLSSVIGFADVLVASPGLGADEQRYAGLVRNAGRRLLSIVNDVLDLAKIESGIVPLDAAPVDLRPLAADTLEMVRLQAAEKGLTLHIDLPRGPVLVQTDADRIRQILLNLLGNAVKFTESGAVTLALRAAPGAAGVAVEMSVTDTGIGIPRHRINRLFQRFEQGDNSITRQYGGTGLGLAICHELVVQMGGTITAASEPGLGTCFTVKLELPAASAPPAAEARYDPTGALAGLRILVAEDVKLNQELIGLFLKPAGARIDFVGNGAEAVSAAEGAAYDAIMMDVQMPVMDGLEASRRIRAGSGASRGAPIIALTASVLPEEVDRVRQAGMSDHLGKPFSANDLIATIARWARAGPIAPARAGCLEVAGAAPQMPK